MSNSNGAFITKQQVVDFVREMKDIESEEFTLRKTAEQLKNVEPQRKALVAEIEESEKRVDKIYEEFVCVEKYYKEVKSNPYRCNDENKNYHINKIKSFGAREDKISEYKEFIAENNIEFKYIEFIDPPQCPPKPKNYDKIKNSGKKFTRHSILFGQELD